MANNLILAISFDFKLNSNLKNLSRPGAPPSSSAWQQKITVLKIYIAVKNNDF